MFFTDIQNEVIERYHIDICDGTKCANDWCRTHAHIKERRVCKWKCANSIQSTFALLHEIGHIETTKSKMRRAESEYYATKWALDRCREFGIKVPAKIIDKYQKYIDLEIERGKRRGGSGYGNLQLLSSYQKQILSHEEVSNLLSVGGFHTIEIKNKED